MSKRSHEGYLLIDNRESPGVSDAELREISPGLPPGAGRGLFEAPTITCSHCQKILIVNPLRTRERAYCQKCDHYICDNCGLALKVSGVCLPFAKLLDTLDAAQQRQENAHG